MILEIKKYPSPVLKNKTEEVLNITPGIRELVLDMIETMREKQGIGLAAPQVGVLKRIIVIETPEGPKGFINPQVLKRSKETETIEEGCLSFPGLFLKIRRAKEVEIIALDEDGKEIQMEVRGLLARIFQHEIDHLDGILFFDRLHFWQRLKIKPKLKFTYSS